MRVLDWNLPLERLDKIARAFGHYGSLAMIDGAIHAVHAHEIRKTAHSHLPGTPISRENNFITMATNGGYFIIKKSEIVG
jgi:methionyl-tRNA formyltransferase